MATPLMGLVLPVPGTTPGPSYGEQLVAALEVLDGHSHAPGSGARITTAAMLVDADLSFGGFFATSLKASKYADQAAVLGTGEQLAIYAVNGDLHWNNGAGTAVRITSGVGLNAASIGGIGGDYQTSTANVTYTDVTKVFAFTQSAGVAAKMAHGSIAISEEVSAAASVTLQSPSALAGSYSVTLFAALPATNGVVEMSAAGVLNVVTAPGADSLLQSTSGGVLSYVTSLPIGFKMTSAELTTPKIADSAGGQFYNFAVSDLAADRIVTLPLLTGNDTFVFEAHAGTLQNKTLDDPKFSNPARTFNYTILGSAIVADRNLTIPLLTGDDTLAVLGLAQSLSNKTLPAPVLSGTITGTYTLGGTPTITAPTISGPTLSGTVLGTYTLGGTPTITAPAISNPTITGGGSLAGTFTGTPTFSGSLVFSGAPSFTGLPVFSNASGLSTDDIVERTAAAGVTIDGVLLKDNGIQTDSGGTNEIWRTRTIQIGDWNMDTTPTRQVTHGLTLSKIRTITVIIIADDSLSMYELNGGTSGTGNAGHWSPSATNVLLTRITSGNFDNTLFNATSFNRGHVIVTYAV